MDTPEGRTAWCQPLPTTGLRLADYEAPMEDPSKPYPFELEGAGSTYQNAIHHLFIDCVERDHITDLYIINPTDSSQPVPVVNMVAIRQLSDEPSLSTKSLHNIPNESPDDYSRGSTKTTSSYPAFPSGFGA